VPHASFEAGLMFAPFVNAQVGMLSSHNTCVKKNFLKAFIFLERRYLDIKKAVKVSKRQGMFAHSPVLDFS
jgi:hypothetical protein